MCSEQLCRFLTRNKINSLLQRELINGALIADDHCSIKPFAMASERERLRLGMQGKKLPGKIKKTKFKCWLQGKKKHQHLINICIKVSRRVSGLHLKNFSYFLQKKLIVKVKEGRAGGRGCCGKVWMVVGVELWGNETSCETTNNRCLFHLFSWVFDVRFEMKVKIFLNSKNTFDF